MKCEMLISSLLAFGLLAGCTEEIGFGSPPKSGATLFAQNCAVCHGANARGAGAAAVNLEQVPADLTLIAERNGGLFPSDDVLAKIHGYGGPGHFGEMPDFADIDRGENIMWETQNGQKIATPRALVALVRYLEGLQR
ncbi:MAG: c-type cytochrome [Lentibacter sp.]|jgi:mono/diheme cytochrome c family protein|uniref:c-type cytochrome n=1 Tax=Lentibacter sp. TaxID=2024994 RepID=UPI002639EE7B|nr:c-type cytochrome [Lentibacter sp.]MDG1288999.1 c-type cytochrome [Lentibacter sp.]